MIKCIDELLLKFREMIPAVQEQIMKWADEAGAAGKVDTAEFFSAAGRMLNAAITKIDEAIVGFRRKIGE